MGTLYENILSLCKKRDIKPGRVCNDLGLSRGLMTDLKMGRKKSVSAETAQKIAEYFGVTVGYLLTGEESENASTDIGEANEMTEILQEFRDNPDLRTLFSLSSRATPEELKQYVNVIKALRGDHD